MKILTEARQIRDALEEVEPTHIAVAYVGADWEDYISVNDLDEIIISPTHGSNPKAIESIMKKIGNENVYFLNELHSKIYIGSNYALVGSCNLTYNAMSGKKLLEVAILLDDDSSVSKLLGAFNEYKKLAEFQYPNFESKKKQLKELKEKWNTSVQHGLVTDNSGIPELSEYCSELDKIHIVWYPGAEKVIYNEESANNCMLDTKGRTIEDYFREDYAFLEEDPIEPGDWILGWHITSKGCPSVKINFISWMYVHHVIPYGYAKTVDDPYTKLAGETDVLKKPNPPFNLDNSVTIQIIRDALMKPQFSALRRSRVHWSLAPADKVTPSFIEYIKKRAREVG